MYVVYFLIYCVVGLDFIFDVLIIYNECEVFLDGKILWNWKIGKLSSFGIVEK